MFLTRRAYLGVVLLVTLSGGQPASCNELKTKAIVRIRHGATYYVNIRYPQFSGINPRSIQPINRSIKNGVLTVFQGSEIRHALGGGRKHSYTCEFRTAMADSEFVSVETDFSSFTGGAHPNFFVKSFNFCVSPYKRIKLSDVLSNQPQTYELLSKLCQQKLLINFKSKDLPTGYIDDGISPKAEFFETFTFDKKGLKFIFQPYSVGPYIAGIPEATLSYRELKPVIRRNSVLWKIASKKL